MQLLLILHEEVLSDSKMRARVKMNAIQSLYNRAYYWMCSLTDCFVRIRSWNNVVRRTQAHEIASSITSSCTVTNSIEVFNRPTRTQGLVEPKKSSCYKSTQSCYK